MKKITLIIALTFIGLCLVFFTESNIANAQSWLWVKSAGGIDFDHSWSISTDAKNKQ